MGWAKFSNGWKATYLTLIACLALFMFSTIYLLAVSRSDEYSVKEPETVMECPKQKECPQAEECPQCPDADPVIINEECDDENMLGAGMAAKMPSNDPDCLEGSAYCYVPSDGEWECVPQEVASEVCE